MQGVWLLPDAHVGVGEHLADELRGTDDVIGALEGADAGRTRVLAGLTHGSLGSRLVMQVLAIQAGGAEGLVEPGVEDGLMPEDVHLGTGDHVGSIVHQRKRCELDEADLEGLCFLLGHALLLDHGLFHDAPVEGAHCVHLGLQCLMSGGKRKRIGSLNDGFRGSVHVPPRTVRLG